MTVIGWAISFMIGCFVTYLRFKLHQERRRLAWSVEYENELVSPQLSEHAGTPVRIMVANQTTQALAVIALKIACTGNKAAGRTSVEDDDLQFKICTGATTKILDVQLTTESEESARHTSHTLEADGIRLQRKFMNPRDEIHVRLLVAEYQHGTVDVRLSYPNVSLQRVTPNEYLRLGLSTKSVALSFLGIGIRTDPTAVALYEINRSIRSIEGKLVGSRRSGLEPTGSKGAQEER